MDYQKTWEVMSNLEESFNRIKALEDMVEDLVEAVNNDDKEQIVDISHAIQAYLPVYISQYDKVSKKAWNNTVLAVGAKERQSMMRNDTTRWREMSGDGKYKDDIDLELEAL